MFWSTKKSVAIFLSIPTIRYVLVYVPNDDCPLFWVNFMLFQRLFQELHINLKTNFAITPLNHIETTNTRWHHGHPLLVDIVLKQKSFVDFVDDHSIIKLFHQNYLCTRHVIHCERIYYETFPPNISKLSNLWNFSTSKLFTYMVPHL